MKEDVQEQDEEDDEDDEDEDDKEAEEDKGDGSAHSVVVADLNEAPGERGALEGGNQTNQGKTKAKAKATKTRRRRSLREGSQIPANHSQIRDQTNYDDRRRLIWSIGSPRKKKTKKPCQAHESILTFTQANRKQK